MDDGAISRVRFLRGSDAETRHDHFYGHVGRVEDQRRFRGVWGWEVRREDVGAEFGEGV